VLQKSYNDIRPGNYAVCPAPLDVAVLKRLKNLRVLQLVIHVDDDIIATEWKATNWRSEDFIPQSYFDLSDPLAESKYGSWMVHGIPQAQGLEQRIKDLGITAKFETMVHIY
jgi:hypothetical protein